MAKSPFSWTKKDREARRFGASSQDQRTAAERDRDRILYSSAFRRLSGITQIVRADEADVFHTRQQHTLKVAQVGRRLAEKCCRSQEARAKSLGVDAEVVEAACLAHDLGHPPFGHIGETALHEKVVKYDPDGYEGNAQSFRILTKLAVRFDDEGLDLTRATLAATLKYPWFRDTKVRERTKKWSVFKSEKDDFDFARERFSHHVAKTAEAELMDWADDIAYSVHDLEDFHRCNALPWRRILSAEGTSELVNGADARWWGRPSDSKARLREACRRLLSLFEEGNFTDFLYQPYDGTRKQRQDLRTVTSSLIGRYIGAVKLKDAKAIGKDCVCVEFDDTAVEEIKILKQITHDYIINSPTLAAQQKGQRRIIEALFDDLYSDSGKSFPPYLPARLRYLWNDETTKARFAADCIASLTEGEAIGLHARLHGRASGSVLDPIVR